LGDQRNQFFHQAGTVVDARQCDGLSSDAARGGAEWLPSGIDEYFRKIDEIFFGAMQIDLLF
jgi:hypothetical protein